MDRLIAPNTVDAAHADQPPASGTPGYATDGNPATGIPATNWPAYAWNALQEEAIAVIVAGGLTPNKASTTQIRDAILALIAINSAGIIGASANLSMNLSAASATATWTADQVVVAASLSGLRIPLSSINLTINLATTGAGGMDAGSSPANANVAVYVIYNPTTGAKALLGQSMGSAVAPVCYGGANMPSGYTQSALISVLKTNGSGLFAFAYGQRGRGISLPPVGITITTPSTLTQLSIATAVPANATKCSGTMVATTSGSLNLAGNISSNSLGTGQQEVFSSSAAAAVSLGFSFDDLEIFTPQSIWYSMPATGSGSVSAATLQISRYEI